MLNNIGLPGLVVVFGVLLVFLVLPIWLITRSGGRKAKDQARIADALEEIAKSRKEQGRSK